MDKKKILKKIESLERQKEIHKDKIRRYEGRKSYLKDYLDKEIERMDEDIRDEKRRFQRQFKA